MRKFRREMRKFGKKYKKFDKKCENFVKEKRENFALFFLVIGWLIITV